MIIWTVTRELRTYSIYAWYEQYYGSLKLYIICTAVLLIKGNWLVRCWKLYFWPTYCCVIQTDVFLLAINKCVYTCSIFPCPHAAVVWCWNRVVYVLSRLKQRSTIRRFTAIRYIILTPCQAGCSYTLTLGV